MARSACSAPMSTFSMNWTSGLAGQERAVGVVGLARLIAGVEAVGRGGHELRVGDRRLDRLVEALHAALRPELGRVAAGDGEDLDVGLVVVLHPLQHGLGGVRAFLAAGSG